MPGMFRHQFASHGLQLFRTFPGQIMLFLHIRLEIVKFPLFRMVPVDNLPVSLPVQDVIGIVVLVREIEEIRLRTVA